MVEKFKALSVTTQTLLVFIVSAIITLPLMYGVTLVFDSELVRYVGISALGWFAGGAIVGTYILARTRRQ